MGIFDIFLQNLLSAENVHYNIMFYVKYLAGLSIFFFVFQKIVLFFNKKRPFSSNKNFTLAHEEGIKDTDLKCEAFYPFLDAFIATPILVASHNVMYYVLPESMQLNLFAYYLPNAHFIIKLLFALLVLEICLYIRHRISHEFMWSFHAVHHCAHKISWTTTFRAHPIDAIIMGLIQSIILYSVGISIEVISMAIMIFSFWNAFIHCNIQLDFPKPFKYIFGSPNFHRWHHATNPEAHNKNYCNIFAFIDYIMGTYYCPDNILPEKYGSSIKTLDNHKDTNILNELYYPISRQFKRIAKIFAKK